MRILVTGANGFVGTVAVRHLRSAGHLVRPVTRAEIGEIGPDTDWRPVLRDCHAVLHLANRAHVLRERGDPWPDLARVNVAGTLALAAQAAEMGVRRFVFLSSIKAVAEASPPGRPLTEDDAPAPPTAYGRAKLLAEQGLSDISGLRALSLRPPLVTGQGAKGNWARLVRLVRSGLPLPFGSIDNRRSLVSVRYLAGAALRALEGTETGVRHVVEGPPLSLPDMLRAIAADLKRPPPPLVSVPPALLRPLLGTEAWQRLAGDLWVASRRRD